jgi:hypothetical protein
VSRVAASKSGTQERRCMIRIPWTYRYIVVYLLISHLVEEEKDVQIVYSNILPFQATQKYTYYKILFYPYFHFYKLFIHLLNFIPLLVQGREYILLYNMYSGYLTEYTSIHYTPFFKWNEQYTDNMM